MIHHNVLNLTRADRSSIANWRRAMLAAIALMVCVTLAGPDLYRRYSPLFGMAMASAQPQPMPLTQECARRDATYFVRLEEESQRPDPSGEKLHRAFIVMLEARTLCNAGRQNEAFALYDEGFGTLGVRSIATADGVN